jgi:hypothetical protein
MARYEPGDYYLEDGLVVFTSQFHLKRGRCCGCDCRHCPWRDGKATAAQPSALPLAAHADGFATIENAAE